MLLGAFRIPLSSLRHHFLFFFVFFSDIFHYLLTFFSSNFCRKCGSDKIVRKSLFFSLLFWISNFLSILVSSLIDFVYFLKDFGEISEENGSKFAQSSKIDVIWESYFLKKRDLAPVGARFFRFRGWKLEQTSIKKTMPKSINKTMPFKIDFWNDVGGFFDGKWKQFGTQTGWKVDLFLRTSESKKLL